MAPLSFKRKRVDNSGIEEQRITNYDAMWRIIDEALTKHSTFMDSWILKLDNLCLKMNIVKGVLMIKTGKGNYCIKEKESNQISCDKKLADNGGLGGEQVHDYYQQPHLQSGRSSYNLATNFEALKMEMNEFFAQVNRFIKQVIDRYHSLQMRMDKIELDMDLILEMLSKAHSSPDSVHTIPASK